MIFGLKIWSINHDSFEKINEFYKNGVIDYVELYTYPESFNKKALSALLNIPIIFHAPTFLHGMNLCDNEDKNKKIIKDIRQYIEFFNKKKVIFHPGVMVETIEKSIENTIHNLNLINKEFDIILENVPAIGIDDKSIMLAASPADFEKIVKGTKVKTCLDFGHAIMAANYTGKDPFKYIEKFLKNKPYMFHLSDGDFNSHIDKHLSFGDGTFPLAKIVKTIPQNGRLSLETPKNDFKFLHEDLMNLKVIKRLICKSQSPPSVF